MAAIVGVLVYVGVALALDTSGDDYRAENEALRAEVADLRRCAVQMNAAAVAQVTAMGLTVRADGCLSPREAGDAMSVLLTRDAEALVLIAELGAVIDEAAARRGAAACTTGAIGVLAQLPLPGLIECVETVLAALTSPPR